MAECKLCHSKVDNIVIGADSRTYYSCAICALIFADKRHHLDSKQEKERYLNHINSLKDSDYLDFLSRAVNPALPFLNSRMKGLDYGCGPVTAIQHILQKESIECDSYDPFFLPKMPQPPYDFIFSTEVFEHFFNPSLELTNISGMLKNEGLLIVMTEFHQGKYHLKDWYYTRDPSHVCFYNLDTFNFICKHFKFKRIFTDNKRVIILKKIG